MLQIARYCSAREIVKMRFLRMKTSLIFVKHEHTVLTVKRNLTKEAESLGTKKIAFSCRSKLRDARRVVVKLGSAVITREDQSGLALGRLASIVEQISQLQNEGREMLMVTSGAVAFGKQKLRAEMKMSMSMRETLSLQETIRQTVKANRFAGQRAASAVGQSGLMALYDVMFSQYGVNIAQVLVTKPDFYNPDNRFNLKSTVLELLGLNVIPIVNTNDTVASAIDSELPTHANYESYSESSIINIKDNDSLSAHLAVEVEADLLILLSDVDGIYTLPPNDDGARLLHNYCPSLNGNVTFGEKSRVGLGGMESKVRAASWALERGVAVVICNGMAENSVGKIIQGRKIGTFFTNHESLTAPVETLALNARRSSRILQQLSSEQRKGIILQLADFLQSREDQILFANSKDLKQAKASGLTAPLLSRLSLTSEKLTDLSNGLKQIAHASHTTLNKIMKRTLIAEGIELQQITVPIGVLLVIFESRPDCLPQIAALSIATGNGLLLKGGKEASHSNCCLYKLVQEALSQYNVPEAVSLVSTREDVSELLQMEDLIDLVIPRGSSQLVRDIKQQSRGITVLGHSEGICHVYVDEFADTEKAIKIVQDSKCDYPAACNAMETLLIHKNLMETDFLVKICDILKKEKVKINSGPRLHGLLTFGPPCAKSMKTEYGSLECTVEVVETIDSAIDHINNYSSGHTDVIVTEDGDRAEKFLKSVESACVFHNCSSRFSDGYRFGLGAEVGISTSRFHVRGPVGVEGLLTTKWVLRGSGHIVADFNKGGSQNFIHKTLPLQLEQQ